MERHDPADAPPMDSSRRTAVLAGAFALAAAVVAFVLPWPLQMLVGNDGQGAFLYLWTWLCIPCLIGATVSALPDTVLDRAIIAGAGLLGSMAGPALHADWRAGAPGFLAVVAAAACVTTALGIDIGMLLKWIVFK